MTVLLSLALFMDTVAFDAQSRHPLPETALLRQRAYRKSDERTFEKDREKLGDLLGMIKSGLLSYQNAPGSRYPGGTYIYKKSNGVCLIEFVDEDEEVMVGRYFRRRVANQEKERELLQFVVKVRIVYDATK